MNSAGAIICWKNKILLFHRDNIPTIPAPDCWSLPGGGIEKGETPFQGLKRELMEEVSFVPQEIHFLEKILHEKGIAHIYLSFVSDNEAKSFKHGMGEGQEIKFFTINEALKLKLTPALRNYITKFKEEIKKAMKEKSFPKIIL